MNAGTLCRWQVVNAPPAHLQEDEREDKQPHCQTRLVVWQATIVNINKVCEPSDGSPCLFWVPRPIVSPSFLSPKSTKEHAEGHKGETDIDKVVQRRLSIEVGGVSFLEKQIDCHQRAEPKNGISKHIDDDVRGEPWALKGWHQRLVVDLGLEQVHADEHQGENRGKR